MKISIAQLVSGSLISQLKNAVKYAQNDKSDLLVFPAFTFDSPYPLKDSYDRFETALYLIADLVYECECESLHLLLPFINKRGKELYIHAHGNSIEIYSSVRSGDLEIGRVSNKIFKDFEMEVNGRVRLYRDACEMFSVDGMRIGCIFDSRADVASRENHKESCDTLLYFHTAPVVYWNGLENKDAIPANIEDIVKRKFADQYVCIIHNCGLYGEFAYRGGTRIVDVNLNLVGECPAFKYGVFSANLGPVQKRWGQDWMEAMNFSREPLDISFLHEELLVDDTLQLLKLSMRSYLTHMEARSVIIPLLDTFTSHFLFNLVCEEFKDVDIVAIANEEFPHVNMRYDLDKPTYVVYVSSVEGGGHEKIEGMYQACQRIARYSDGLAIIPECMSDYIQNHMAPTCPNYVFAPFSHLLYSDLLRIKDAFEREVGKGPSFDFDTSSLSTKAKRELKEYARSCADVYLSSDYDEACDAPSALGRLWDRSDFDAQEVLSDLSSDPVRMRYLLKTFYKLMDEVVYGRYNEVEWGKELTSVEYQRLSSDAKDQIRFYRVRGLSYPESVAQGIFFREPLRDMRPMPGHFIPDVNPIRGGFRKPFNETLSGISFSYEKPESGESDIDDEAIRNVIDLAASVPDPRDPLSQIDPAMKEKLLSAIADALGGDEEDNPARYMLDMYKLASLTEDSEYGNNLFSQN